MFFATAEMDSVNRMISEFGTPPLEVRAMNFDTAMERLRFAVSSLSRSADVSLSPSSGFGSGAGLPYFFLIAAKAAAAAMFFAAFATVFVIVDIFCSFI